MNSITYGFCCCLVTAIFGFIPVFGSKWVFWANWGVLIYRVRCRLLVAPLFGREIGYSIFIFLE